MADKPKQDEQKTERFNMFMSPSEMKAIDDWAWENKIRSKSEAVRRLCQIALLTEPLVNELPRLWHDVQQADIDISGSLLDAFSNIDTMSTEENLERIKTAVDNLVPAAMELGIHADAMASVYEALKKGGNLEESIEDLKKKARQSQQTREFIKENWKETK